MRGLTGVTIALLACGAPALQAQDYSWPREIPISGGATGTIVLYQPQAEKLEGNDLTARGAIALKVAGRPDPIFGAMWMSAKVDVDRDSGMVWLHDVRITRVRWPDATAEQQTRFTQYVEADFPKAGFRITLARLQASLASAESELSHTEGLKNDAPKVVFSEQLAVLLLYDGEPRLQAIPNTGLALIVNTPFGVVKDTATATYWLGAGEAMWYSATDPKGPWKPGATPPAAILKLTGADSALANAEAGTTRPDTLFAAEPTPSVAAPSAAASPTPPTTVAATTDSGSARRDSAAARPDSSAARRDSSALKDSTAARTDTAATRPDTTHPRTDTAAVKPDTLFAAPLAIVTATEPTELVATDGPPRWKTTAGGKLLYVENTETPWIRETEGTDNYLLISGRWFKSASLQGPWTFARPDSLPKSFQDIPADSPIGGVRGSIALTVEAQDAVLDLQIPQTTAVQRNQAKFTAKYDGQPKFLDIPGISVAYATNTGSAVLRTAGPYGTYVYWACDNAVWFKSASASGPWFVADSIPKDLFAKIPPSVPVYNVTYVQIYASTPEVVYVGYTPGYTGSYPYYGVPVYGTGYAYPPYSGTVYYPYPVTYGVAVSYNPYTGWGAGTTFATTFFAFGVGMAIGNSARYYPVGGYHGCFNCTVNRPAGGRGGAGNRANIGNTAGGGNRQRPSSRPKASQRPSNSNVYNRPQNKTRNADRVSRDRAATQVGGANRRAGGSNNVFADRNGNVHRRSGNGWESRQGNNWSRDRGGSNYGNRGGGDREYGARQRSSSRGGGGGSRGGGGGGGRRR